MNRGKATPSNFGAISVLITVTQRMVRQPMWKRAFFGIVASDRSRSANIPITKTSSIGPAGYNTKLKDTIGNMIHQALICNRSRLDAKERVPIATLIEAVASTA